MKKTVIFRGPVLTESGYGTHARQIVKYLIMKHEAGVIQLTIDATQWGNTPWLINTDDKDGLIGKIMCLTVRPQSKPDVSIQLQLPNEWDPNLAMKNIGVTAGVETDRCNPAWIKCVNAMDGVIVPSKFTQTCFKQTGDLTTDITVIPESFNEKMIGNVEPLDTEFDTDFNFLVFGQITGNNKDNDRKNLLNTIKLLCDAFHEDKDVGIVLKTNAGRNTQIDRNVTRGTFTQILAQVRRGSAYPKVHLLHGSMTDKEVAGLMVHPKIKALVTLTRGEGYGLPVLEAAASGLPVIATNWSGLLDFMDKGKFIKIDYNLKQIHSSRADKNIFMPNAKWAEPIEDDAKQKLIKFRKSSDIPKQWANDLKEIIQRDLSFESICKSYDEYFKGLL